MDFMTSHFSVDSFSKSFRQLCRMLKNIRSRNPTSDITCIHFLLADDIGLASVSGFYQFDFGLRFPKRARQGAFFVTCSFNNSHHKAVNVRQLFDPSIYSDFGNEACSQRKSQNRICEEVTPALPLSSIIISLPVYN